MDLLVSSKKDRWKRSCAFFHQRSHNFSAPTKKRFLGQNHTPTTPPPDHVARRGCGCQCAGKVHSPFRANQEGLSQQGSKSPPHEPAGTTDTEEESSPTTTRLCCVCVPRSPGQQQRQHRTALCPVLLQSCTRRPTGEIVWRE